MNAKYVVIDGQDPYLFAITVKHSYARKLGNITSAGFVSVVPVFDPVLYTTRLHFRVYGHSRSLDLGPKPDDQFLIETFFTLMPPGEES